MKTDWERLREVMLRPEINKIIAKDRYTAQDACDLKVLLKNLEMSYTNEMFEEEFEEEHEYEEGGASGVRRGRRRGSYDAVRNSHMFRDYDHDYDRSVHYDRYASGHSEKEIFKNQLESMMHSATDAHAKQALQDAINSMK